MDDMKFFLGGLFAGLLLMMIILGYAPGSILKEAHEVLRECEKDLPRSIKCVLTAVPAEKTNHD